MNISRLRVAVVCLALAPGALAAQEGVATYKYILRENSAAPDGQSRVYFSPTGARVEMQLNMSQTSEKRRSQGGAPTTIKMTTISKVSEPDRLYSVNDENKTYSVTDLAKIREGNREMDRVTYTVQRQGSDRVAGIACEKALVTSSKGDQIEVCVSNAIAGSSNWLSAMNRQSGHNNWFKSMNEAGLKGFPIRMKFHGAAVGAEIEMELVSLEKKSVPASMFQIPAGYRETSAMGVGMSSEQEKQMKDALSRMTPEQRKAYEDAMRGKKQ